MEGKERRHLRRSKRIEQIDRRHNKGLEKPGELKRM